MTIDNKARYYILMADVINSRVLEGGKMMQDLKTLVSVFSKQNKNEFLSPMTITLGDEFQAIVKNLAGGIQLLVKLEEKIIEQALNLKLRYVLTLGEIDTPINKDYAHEMYGEGFIRAREKLNESKEKDRRFYFELGNQQSKLFDNIFFLYSSLVDNWKLDDYRLIHCFLQEKDYYVVSKKLDINRGTVWKKERSLNIQQYFAIKEVIKESLKK
jgi:hypothetical protein